MFPFFFSFFRNYKLSCFVLVVASSFSVLSGCFFEQSARQTNPPAVEEPVKVNVFDGVEGDVVDVRSEEQFIKIIDSGGICFVVLYSGDCGPCRFIEPVMKRIAAEYADAVTVCRVDIDRIYYAVRRYEPRGYPTALIIKGGEEVKRFLGTVPLEKYYEALDELIAEDKKQVQK